MQSQQVEDKQSSDIITMHGACKGIYHMEREACSADVYRHLTDKTSLKCQGTSMRIHGRMEVSKTAIIDRRQSPNQSLTTLIQKIYPASHRVHGKPKPACNFTKQ